LVFLFSKLLTFDTLLVKTCFWSPYLESQQIFWSPSLSRWCGMSINNTELMWHCLRDLSFNTSFISHFHVIWIINYITIIKELNNKLLLKLKDNWENKKNWNPYYQKKKKIEIPKLISTYGRTLTPKGSFLHWCELKPTWRVVPESFTYNVAFPSLYSFFHYAVLRCQIHSLVKT